MTVESGGETREGYGRGAVRVACLLSDPETARLVEQLLRIWAPDIEVAAEATGDVRGVPAVDAILLDAPDSGEDALDALRRVRASGFAGAVVVVALGESGERAPLTSTDWRRLGGAVCPLGANAGARLATTLAEALEDAEVAREDESGHTPAAKLLRREVGETRRLIAVAEVALQLQHSLNNPLAALMAEAQLMEMEEQLMPEQRSAVRRMVELCRRMSATLRTLDVAPEVERPRSAARPEPGNPRGRSADAMGGWFAQGSG